MADTNEIPWHAAFPKPRNQADSVTHDEVKQWLLSDSKKAGKDFLLVDVRRTDYEGGTIKTSLNLPAQSFYGIRPTLYALLHSAGVRKVVFYCGASNGRGPRIANWFADYLEDVKDSSGIKSLVLFEGIKGWAYAGPEYTALIDGYEKNYWAQFAPGCK